MNKSEGALEMGGEDVLFKNKLFSASTSMGKRGVTMHRFIESSAGKKDRCRDDGLQAMMLVNPWWLGQDRLLLIISVKNESRSRE